MHPVPDLLDLSDDWRLTGTDLYLDSRQPRAHCFVSHAHSDHIAPHQRVIATRATAAFLSHREPGASATVHDPGTDFSPQPALRARLTPAGHVLGSAMLHVTTDAGRTLLYTGDFKLRQSLTVEQARPLPADTLLMESTYGRPFFKFPPWRQTHAQLLDLVTAALRAGRQPIVMGYSLGKAQEITRILTTANLPVTVHGAVHTMNRLYEEQGVPLGPYRRYRVEDVHGPRALDLSERGVLVTPPNMARTPMVTRFKSPCRIVMTGWSLLKNAIYRYGVDHALPLSDHADFTELLELIDLVRPQQILTCHGPPEFAQTLRDLGLNAHPVKCDPQLSLFD